MTPPQLSSEHPLHSAPVVAQVERSGFVESVHHGVVAVTAADGGLELSIGPVGVPIFPRSSNKPLQALAMVRNGLDLPDHLLALACASHNGEELHLAGVREILATAGLLEDDLQNTPDRPLHEPDRERWIAEGLPARSIAQNCSGKHAAMLATCVLNDWDTVTYRDPQHPLQVAMADTLAELSGETVAATGVDGCGAPVMAISTAGLAKAFGRLAAAGEETPEGRVARAVRQHPEYLGGTGRDVTDLIRAVPGLIAKDGAEAVYAIGLADGRGLALKITDGNQRARTVVARAALQMMGVTEDLTALDAKAVLGHGEPVGTISAVGVGDVGPGA
ncbi:asparaginase [Ornithinimicrobium cavernae]|uniref:asparaginase n=1 Tax=Ornithinimicrobium cavernae TaxID=2666047 RepID=UPI000D6866FE|nr:asparaginase [Ornithinimicrobium cavernae]